MYNKLLDQILTNDERNHLIGTLLHRCDNEQTIILTSRREHCHTLDTLALEAGVRSGLFIGGPEYAKEFKKSVDDMRSGELRLAVGTYQAVGVGFDIPAITRGIFASQCANSPKGKEQFDQFCGRFERPAEGKDNSLVYYLWDQHVFGYRALHNLKRWKKNVTVLLGDKKISLAEYLKGKSDAATTKKTKRPPFRRKRRV